MKLFTCRVLKKVKDYTIFPVVWLNEVRPTKQSRLVAVLVATLTGYSVSLGPSVSPDGGAG